MPLWYYSDGQVNITYKDHQKATAVSSSHTFSAMAISPGFVIACIAFQGSLTGMTVSSVTIGGVTPTQIGTLQAATNGIVYLAMYIANISSGTTADVVINVSGGNGLAWGCTTYAIDGIASSTPAQTVTSTASNPTASLSCNAGGGMIGCAIAASLSSPSATWTGITEDFDDLIDSLHRCLTSAHQNFTAAQSSLTVTCTFSSTLNSAGIFAAFNP